MVRFCSKCESKHAKPTGRKCKRSPPKPMVDFSPVDDIFEDFVEDTHTALPSPHGHQAQPTPIDDNKPTEDRVQELEDRMLAKFASFERSLLKAIGSVNPKTSKTPSSPYLDSCSSSEEEGACASPPRTKAKKKFRSSKFIREGETITSFEGVILVAIRTIQAIYDSGEDPTPVIRHAEFLAKKASMIAYKPESYIGYDQRVRERANYQGITAFAEVAAEDIATYFCQEHMIARQSKAGRQQATVRKPKRTCINYNESSCSYKGCQYAHICAACEDPSHGRRDCPLIRKMAKPK